MIGALAQAAYSAESALELAFELKPDIVISDVVMGQMSGVELALRLSSELPNCRLILISGQSAYADFPSQIAKDGFNFEFLQKPITPQRLLSHIGLPVPSNSSQTSGRAA